MRMLAAVFAALLATATALSAAAAQPGRSFADLNDRLSPAVVNIATAQRLGAEDGMPVFPPGSPLERFNDMLGEGPRMARSLGSGFVIDADGVVVTNNHVIEDADEVEVVFQDGRILPAEVIGRDSATDIAVLRVEAGEPLPFVRWGESDAARVGDWVVAIGNPFGLGGSLTAGVISARGREIGGRYDDYLQTDVAINRGNSGGPLFDMDGRVIAVNTAIFSPTGASVGISFSVPSAVARPVVEQLLEFGETRRGWLGVNVQPVTRDMARAMGLSEARGAIVTRIDPDGPAAGSGLQVGDVVLAFGGRRVADDRALPRIVAETAPGERVEIEVFRRGESVTVDVTIARLEEEGGAAARPPAGAGAEPGPRPGPGPAPSSTLFGLTLEPLTDALRRQFRVHPSAEGLVVTAVDPDSDAAGKVRPGDVVEEIAWTRVGTVEEARALVAGATGPVLFSLDRQGQDVFQTLRP